MVFIDSFGAYFKLIFIGSTIITVVLAMMYDPFKEKRMGEFFAILLCSVIGMCLMASATDLLLFYLALEMVSIPSYILVVYLKDNQKGSEASLKYAIYGSVASGLMIFGLSLFYGMTGTTEIAEIGGAISKVSPFTLVIACVLVLGGFAYKMAAVPMHFWCPDVYEGAPTPVTAWLSVASKAAGFAMLLRFLWVSFSEVGETVAINWPGLIALVSVVTMTYGNLAALWQENLKRLLAYSSIAHAGYMLMGVALYREAGFPGFQAVAFYFLVYLFMNLGAFAVVIAVENRLKSDRMESYHGLGYRAPFIGVMMTICLFSLIGVPPTGGFVGKFQIFAAVVKGGFIWLAIAAGINTAISVWYYTRIIRRMYLDDPDDTSPLGLPLMARVVIAALVIPVLYLGIFYNHAAQITQGLNLFASR
jgi:NADH-quinone oxidoreductase subunit N